MVAIFVVATIIVFFVIDYFVQRAEKNKVAQAVPYRLKRSSLFPRGIFLERGTHGSSFCLVT